ncbi:MAG: LLM class flavin-dependent oxidoreductase [Caldilineaceae bacterium]|jgi:5,10-methylenetetrahydromethanopterin reductase|nr:LLM class flavin-dependent oxidoreductase [Caldilineaceae bacterium]
MTQLGIQIIPTMPVDEVIELAVMAEELGYDFCLLADEGFMPDVYVALGAIAQRTSRMRLGPVTNGYTRHPAVTANALATLDDLSSRRALAVLVAGGSMVLSPMGIVREAPLTVMRETIAILRQLWRGEEVAWQGKRFSLQHAQLHNHRSHDIPLWLAVRGEKMLALAGQEADGVVLVAKSDLAPALEIVAQAEAGRTARCDRIYMDRIAYTPELLEEASALYAYVLMDSPSRMLDGLGISEAEIDAIRRAIATGGPKAAMPLVRPDMIQRYQLAGTPDECRQAITTLVARHELDAIVMNVTTAGIEANRRLLQDIRSIVQA